MEAHPNMIVFIEEEFQPKANFVKKVKVDNINPFDFILGKHWMPTATPAAQFGVLPLILGTL